MPAATIRPPLAARAKAATARSISLESARTLIGLTSTIRVYRNPFSKR